MPGPFARVHGLRPDVRKPLPPHLLNRGRVAWWLAVPGRTIGAGEWFDLAAGLHLTLAGVSVPATTTSGWQGSTRPGSLGAHLLCDGSNDQATAAAVPPGLGVGNVTLAAWAYFSGTSLNAAVVKVGDSSTGFGLGVGNGDFDTAGNNLILLKEAVAWCNSGVAIGTGWHRLLCAVPTGSSPAFYLDGKLIATTGTTANGVAPANNTYVGGYTAPAHFRYFPGPVDDVSVWSRLLSAAEAWADFDLGRRGYPGVLPRTWTASAAMWSAGATATPSGWLVDSPPPARMPIKTVPY